MRASSVLPHSGQNFPLRQRIAVRWSMHACSWGKASQSSIRLSKCRSIGGVLVCESTMRPFDIPLSRPMIRCLIRAMRASRWMHPELAQTWIFAADSEERHLIEHKEFRIRLFKWGNDLRQTYRTLGQAVGLSDIDMHL